MYQKKRFAQKIQMKKQIKAHEERNVKSSAPNEPSSTPLPQYLLDRSQPTNAKVLSTAIKNKRSEKAAKFSVPLPRVRGIAEEEMFKVVKTGRLSHIMPQVTRQADWSVIHRKEDSKEGMEGIFLDPLKEATKTDRSSTTAEDDHKTYFW